MKNKNKIDIIIQARVGSTRLKGKVLKKYKGVTPLKIMIERLKYCKKIKDVIICTTRLPEDNKIVKFCMKENIKYFRGDKNNVLSRYYKTANKFKSDIIVRVTSDCPLVDYRIINKMLVTFLKSKIDYYANTYPLPTRYPDGMDVEIFNFSTLKITSKKAILPSEKEHVTPYMYNSGKFNFKRKDLKQNLSGYRFCIDYKNDFDLFKKILNHFKNKVYNVDMFELVDYVKKNPRLIQYQKLIRRNEGWSSALLKDEKFK
ncbi:glycosyltransferase family protein [Candidatus Pelagibacter sp.]|nr:glycosyltransferase family protein [Candidatus Pelagibacter sp.]